MTTQIQRRRGTTAQHSTFTGAEAELTVDTTKDTVVVHDGSTVGGRPLLREDQSNLPTSAPTTGIYNASGSLAISTGGSGRLFVDASGNIGVGTTTAPPAGHIARFSSFVFAPGFTVNSSGDTGIYSTIANTLQFQTNGSEKVRITSAGLVGIGTSSVDANSKAHIFDSSLSRQLLVQGDANDAAITVNKSGQSFTFGIDASDGNKFKINTGNTVGASDHITIDTSGRLGIGTTSPTSKLQVDSGASANVDTVLVAGTSALFSYAYSSAATGASFYGLSNANTTGIQSFGSAVTFGTYAAQPVIFGTSNAERARIDSSGRLLVGTSTSGSSLLQVNAQASAAGNGLRSSHQIANSGTGVTQTTQAAPYISYLNGLNVGLDATAIAINGEDFASGNTGLRLEFNLLKSSGAVASGDRLGRISFGGDDGTNLIPGAWIDAFVDGGVSANDLPTRLVFSTTADGASSPTERMRIFAEGSVRISNAAFLYPATDNAVSLGATGQRFSAVWAANGTIQTSDQRAKADITTATLGAEFIKALRPVSYKWIEGGKRDTGKRDKDNNYIYEPVSGERTHWGFIAQEVKQAVDAAGVDFGGWVLTDKDDPDSQQALRYDQFIAPLTKALQEALAEIDVLKAKVAALESA